jgi:replication factor A1
LQQLNPYAVGWSVTARVFGKGAARSYTNERGTGQVASCTLIDPSAAMKCVMFGEQVDKFYHVLEVGKVRLTD